MRIGLALALGFGLALGSPASAQNLPSDVEEQLGIPPNSANPDRGGRSYRNPPSDWEQKMRHRAYRNYGYNGHEPRYSYRKAYGHYGYEPRPRYRGAYIHIYARPW
jgi:hypothetical protein